MSKTATKPKIGKDPRTVLDQAQQKFSHLGSSLTRTKIFLLVRRSYKSGKIIPKPFGPKNEFEYDGPDIDFVGDIAIVKNEDEHPTVAFRASAIRLNNNGNYIINPSPDEFAGSDRIRGIYWYCSIAYTVYGTQH